MERIASRKRCRRGRSGLAVKYSLACICLAVFSLLTITACFGPQVQKSPAKGVYHIVKKGETAYSIARAYSISLQDLAEANNITDVSSIREDQVIFIPDADQVIDDVMVAARKADAETKKDPVFKDQKPPEVSKPDRSADFVLPPQKKTPEKPALPEKAGAAPEIAPPPVISEKPRTTVEVKPPVAEKKEDIRHEKGKFIWPVKGTVQTRFGIQPNKTYHNWIKIVCKPGAQVHAAAGGTVIFSANLKDFGETIIIRHVPDYATVYTHLNQRLVKADQNVRRGQRIGRAGEIDEAGATYIHFEIRLKGKARNPLFYLP